MHILPLVKWAVGGTVRQQGMWILVWMYQGNYMLDICRKYRIRF